MGFINTSVLAGGGVLVGQAVFMEESQPSDLTIYGKRYLQSGLIETDTNLFDTSIFTAAGAFNAAAQVTGFTQNVEGISSDGTQFVAVGRPNQISNSSDGVTWNVQASHSFSATVTDVSFGNGVFVAVGWNGIINSSVDAVTWTNRANTFGGLTIEAVNFGGGLFVAVGGSGGGKLETSADGINWNSRSLPSIGADDLQGVGHGNGLHVAVGEGGKIYTSSDGVTWTLQTAPVSTVLEGVAFGNGVFVAVGVSGVILTSSDGVTWTLQTGAHSSAAIYDVAFGNGVFVAVGAGGTWQSSQDGITWTNIIEPSAQNQYGVHIDSVLGGVSVGGGATTPEITTFDAGSFAGSKTAHAENGENQYIRIS